MKDNIITFEDLTAHYGTHAVLKDLNFSVEAEDWVGIVGPNGSGKTTLMRILLGLLEPTSGKIIYREDLCKPYPISYLPQNTRIQDAWFPATVSEIVSTSHVRRFGEKTSIAQAKEKVQETLQSLNILDLAQKQIGQLSGGQLQRVLLARALLRDPKILILDEPTSALDPQSRASFYQLIGSLNREQKVTILLISHDVSGISPFVNKILYLDRSVVFYGSYEQYIQTMPAGSCHHCDHEEHYL